VEIRPAEVRKTNDIVVDVTFLICHLLEAKALVGVII
jgi:hypothetical protein